MDLSYIQKLLLKVQQELMLKPNVVGVAIGEKFTGGISKGELSILTLVKKKKIFQKERRFQ